MGIDIYAKWVGQTKAEQEAQFTGFSVLHGHVGYLREAYHGDPYATKHLVAEAFAAKGHEATIHGSVLRARLPETLRIAEERERKVYGVTDEKSIAAVLKSYTDFVELCEKREQETGWPCLIRASY